MAINWSGGMHHARKWQAYGFCYVNDIVLSILELLRHHARVLYVDIDVHHGDGVEEAFYMTDRVMTLSLHKWGGLDGFFPRTGDVRDVGIGPGRRYSVNVPLKDGISDDAYLALFRPLFDRICEWYRPGAVVLQCGADSLAGDAIGCFNLSLRGHSDCVKHVHGTCEDLGMGLLLLGGGGYTTHNVARAWTYETAVCLGQEIPQELPPSIHYARHDRIDVPASASIVDRNDRLYLERIFQRIVDTLNGMPCAPSVQLHAVPPTTDGPESSGVPDTELLY